MRTTRASVLRATTRRRVLDAKVRPNLQADGGDLHFHGFDEDAGLVRLRLLGACRACPSSTATLRFSISNLLRYEFEGVVEGVEQIFDEGDEIGDGSGWTG